jgi:hypothetical protein
MDRVRIRPHVATLGGKSLTFSNTSRMAAPLLRAAGLLNLFC